MQVGHNNVIRTYQSDIPSLGSFWGVIELQLFIWKVMRRFYFFDFFLSSKIQYPKKYYFFAFQAERLAKQISIEDPYSWDQAQEYDAMTMATFVNNSARTQSVRDTIQAACRSVIGTLCQ